MMNNDIRFGNGIDVHQFAGDRPLILGGVTIPFNKGLKGHSDADVVIHSIIDALLGAAALDDIGTHFPDTDPQYKDIRSTDLLAKTLLLITNHGFRIGNIDITIVAQKPRLRPYIPQMRKTLSSVLSIPIDSLSIKATTTENMGFIGRAEGILTLTTASIRRL